MLVVKGGSLVRARSLGVARPNIYLDLIYILWLTGLGAISRRLALVRTGSIIFEKKNLFIYLFILVAFCLSGSYRWSCFRLVSFLTWCWNSNFLVLF